MSDPFLEYLERPDRESYTSFVLAYAGPVERLARRLVAADQVDDIVQDTFLALVGTKRRAAEIRNPRSFVLQTAFQLTRNHRRAAATRARHEGQAARSKPRLCPSASEEAAAREAVRRLQDSIDALPGQLRLAMHLHALEGLSCEEIATVIECSPESVRVRIHRARQKLKSVLGKEQLGLAFATLEELGPEAALRELRPQESAAKLLELHRELARGSSTAGPMGIWIGLGLLGASLAVGGFLVLGDPVRPRAPGRNAVLSGTLGRVASPGPDAAAPVETRSPLQISVGVGPRVAAAAEISAGKRATPLEAVPGREPSAYSCGCSAPPFR